MLTDQRQVPDVTGSAAKMAQVGGDGVFCGKAVEKDMEMKSKIWETYVYKNVKT